MVDFLSALNFRIVPFNKVVIFTRNRRDGFLCPLVFFLLGVWSAKVTATLTNHAALPLLKLCLLLIRFL